MKMNIVLGLRAIYGLFAGTPFIQPRLASVNSGNMNSECSHPNPTTTQTKTLCGGLEIEWKSVFSIVWFRGGFLLEVVLAWSFGRATHSCHILPFQPLLRNRYVPSEPANTAKHSPQSISEGGRIWQVRNRPVARRPGYGCFPT